MWHWSMAPFMAGNGMFWGGIWWLVGMAATVLFIFLLVRIASPRRCLPTAGDGALDALKLRYARGEIQRDEYERIKKDLER